VSAGAPRAAEGVQVPRLVEVRLHGDGEVVVNFMPTVSHEFYTDGGW
jgi:hypothetical protein